MRIRTELMRSASELDDHYVVAHHIKIYDMNIWRDGQVESNQFSLSEEMLHSAVKSSTSCKFNFVQLPSNHPPEEPNSEETIR